HHESPRSTLRGTIAAFGVAASGFTRITLVPGSRGALGTTGATRATTPLDGTPSFLLRGALGITRNGRGANGDMRPAAAPLRELLAACASVFGCTDILGVAIVASGSFIGNCERSPCSVARAASRSAFSFR